MSQVPSIVTPCHGAPLIVLTTYSGGYLGSDIPNEIICPVDGCFNSWDATGVTDEYNRMPEENDGR